MKVNRMFSIDLDLIERLNKETIKSKCVNDALRMYFDKIDLNEMNYDQLLLEKKIMELKEQSDKEIKRIRDEQNRIGTQA